MRSDGDSILIEVLDGDPSAFAGATAPVPDPRPELPGWLRPTAIAVAVVVVAAAVLVWRPWHHEPEPPLSGRLLLDRPTSAVLNVEIDRQRPPDLTGEVGAVYAEGAATLPWLLTAGGRSLTWIAYAADSANAAYSDFPNGGRAVDDVQGATARVWGDQESMRLVFGPIGGRLFDVSSNGLSLDEVTSVAGAIGMEGGQPVLGGGHDALFDPRGLRLAGTYEELSTAVNLVLGGVRPPTARATTAITYADGAGGTVRIASVAEAESGSTMALLQLLLGPSATATVHGRDAIATSTQVLFSSDSTPDNLVAWHQGGRLIVVTGSADLDSLVAFAEGTHEATEEQWAPVAEQAVDDDGRYLFWQSTIGHRLAADGSIIEITGASNRPGSIDVCVLDQASTECATDSAMRLPFLRVMRIHSAAVVVAMVTARSGESMLRITHADGSVDEHLLFTPGLHLPGPAVAVFLPDDLRDAALVVEGEVVATL